MEIQSKQTQPTLKTGQQQTSDVRGLVTVFANHAAAEEAVKCLQKAGFDLHKISVIGRDYQSEEDVIGFYNTGERVKYWGKVGAFWGGLWGLLVGSAFLLVPGIGPVVVAGTFATSLMAAVEGAVVFGGLSALGAALFSLGVPHDSIVRFETEIKAGKYLMLVNGDNDDVNRAREILSDTALIKDATTEFSCKDLDEATMTKH